MSVWRRGGSAGPAAALSDGPQGEDTTLQEWDLRWSQSKLCWASRTSAGPRDFIRNKFRLLQSGCVSLQIAVFYRASPRHKLKIVKVCVCVCVLQLGVDGAPCWML